MEIFKPLLSKLLELEQSREFCQKGELDKAISLFREITEDCRLLEESPHSEHFLNDIRN